MWFGCGDLEDQKHPLPNPDELTSQLTKLQKTQQVIGYPPLGEGMKAQIFTESKSIWPGTGGCG
jgi:hypothetical protein